MAEFDLFSDIEQSIEEETKSQQENTSLDEMPFAELRKYYAQRAVEHVVELRRSSDIHLDDADTRFSTTIPLNVVRNKTIAIVGAGGIGNWQWRALLGMGFTNIAIFDDDSVGVENIGPQGHSILAIDDKKVDAVQFEAINYRGVAIQTIAERVYSHTDIAERLGYVPDVIITCTDSTSFRNDFISQLKRHICDGGHTEQLPELLMDYRMALGDWSCYAIPARMISSSCYNSDRHNFMSRYVGEAVFTEEQAVQEPCTARAIVYTGMVLAGYTGAFLHWFLTEWRSAVQELPPNDASASSNFVKSYFNHEKQFNWKCSFSSRDWEFITPTKKEQQFRKRLNIANEALEVALATNNLLNNAIIGRETVMQKEFRSITPGDYVILGEGFKPLIQDNNRGCQSISAYRILLIEPSDMTMFIVDDNTGNSGLLTYPEVENFVYHPVDPKPTDFWYEKFSELYVYQGGKYTILTLDGVDFVAHIRFDEAANRYRLRLYKEGNRESLYWADFKDTEPTTSDIYFSFDAAARAITPQENEAEEEAQEEAFEAPEGTREATWDEVSRGAVVILPYLDSNEPLYVVEKRANLLYCQKIENRQASGEAFRIPRRMTDGMLICPEDYLS